MNQARVVWIAGAVAGLTGVALAALGAHAVSGMDQISVLRQWQSINGMHLLHAVVLLVIGSRLQQGASRVLVLAAISMVAGILLFSGSGYLSMMAGISWARPLMPSGGGLLMLGWLLLLWHTFSGDD